MTMYWILFFVTSSLLFHQVLAGDVIIGGIFAEHFSKAPRSKIRAPGDTTASSTCGEPNQRATVDRVAMDFAVREINDSDVILPGISLAVNMKDSCSNLDHAITNTLEYPFVKRKFLNTTVACSRSTTKAVQDQCCMEQESDAPLVAIIAGGYSHIVKAIVNLVGLFKVPVIGYSSTSPSLNKIDYFLRTVPSDTVTTRVMVDLIINFHWNMVSVVYADTEFGHYAADSFRTAIRQKNAKICIAFDEKFPPTSGELKIKDIVNRLKGTIESRVVAFFGTIEDFVFFVETSKRYFDMNEYIWITSEIWPRSDLIGMSRKITNVLSIIPEQSFPLDPFYNYLRSRSDVNLTCLPTRHNMTQHFQGTGTNKKLMGVSNDSSDNGDNCSLAHSMYIPYVFNAVYAVAMALHEMLECEAGKSCKENLKKIQDRSLLEYLRKLNFTNPLTNTEVSFDRNGNPRTTRYTAVKLEVGNNWYKLTLVGHWLYEYNKTACEGRLVSSNTTVINASSFQSICGPPCAAGEHKSVKEKFPDCCWHCKRCTGNKYTNSSSQLSCAECPNYSWPNSNNTACVKINPEYLHMRSGPGILILVWDSLGIVLSICVGVVFVKYSSSHIVRASSRQLSLLLLLGIFIDFSLLIVLLTEPTRIQCTVIFILSHVTGSLLTGTLFIKTNRIHRIFRKSAMKARPRCMGNTCQLFIIFVLVLIEITLTTLNLFFHPETGHVKTTYLQTEDNKKAFLLCNFFGNSFQSRLLAALLWSYNCGMIFICTYQAYLVRKVPENYNEARYITFTMLTISMTIIVYVITDSGMENYNLEVVYCIFQSVRATVVLVCMFFPKVYIILVQPEKNVPHNPVQSKLGTFIDDERASGRVVVPADDERANDGSSARESESSADSTTTCPTRRTVRSHRKIGAATLVAKVDNSETFPNRAFLIHPDRHSESTTAVDVLAEQSHSTGKSLNSSVCSGSTVIVYGLSDSSGTTA